MTRRSWRGRVFIGVTLDGFIARKDGDIEWLTNPPAGNHAQINTGSQPVGWNDFYPSVTHLVIGRGTYEKVLTFDAWPYGGKQVIVMSTTLEKASHDVTIVQSLNEAVSQLEKSGAKDVYVDGGKVIQEFLRAGLIDEITVSIAPVLIGDGLSLFGSLSKDCWLDLMATSSGDSGRVTTTYRVREPLERNK